MSLNIYMPEPKAIRYNILERALELVVLTDDGGIGSISTCVDTGVVFTELYKDRLDLSSTEDVSIWEILSSSDNYRIDYPDASGVHSSEVITAVLHWLVVGVPLDKFTLDPTLMLPVNMSY